MDRLLAGLLAIDAMCMLAGLVLHTWGSMAYRDTAGLLIVFSIVLALLLAAGSVVANTGRR